MRPNSAEAFEAALRKANATAKLCTATSGKRAATVLFNSPIVVDAFGKKEKKMMKNVEKKCAAYSQRTCSADTCGACATMIAQLQCENHAARAEHFQRCECASQLGASGIKRHTFFFFLRVKKKKKKRKREIESIN